MVYWQQLYGSAWTGLIGWTLLHFVWQGLLVAALGALAAISLRGRCAQTRYLVHSLTLLAMTACPVITFAWLAGPGCLSSTTAAVHQNGPAANIPAPLLLAALHAASAGPAVPTAAAPTVLSARILGAADREMPWLVAAWLIGVCLLTIRLCGGAIAVAWIKRTDAAPVCPELEARFALLCERLRLRRRVMLRQTARLDVPVAIGCIRAVVLVPISALTGMPSDQLEALLAHELAHIRRHDYLVNLWQLAAETILFYHPAVWWVSHRIRVEREICCDDVVVAALDKRLDYARALAALEAMRSAGPVLALAGNGGVLTARIRHIVGVPQPETRPARAGRVAWRLVAVLAAFLAMIGLVVAASARSRGALNEELIRAVARADTSRVEAALDRGADPNESATLIGSRETLPLWLRLLMGAEGSLTPDRALQGTDRTVTTPILLAIDPGILGAFGKNLLDGGYVKSCPPPVIEALIRHGAHVDPTALNAAARVGRVDAIGLLLAHGANPNARDDFADTPLHAALAYGQNPQTVDTVRFLLDHGADPDVRDDRGRTPLIQATNLLCTDVVKALLEHGLAPATREKQLDEALAIERRHIGRQESIIHRVGKRPGLHMFSRDEEIIQLLVRAGAR